MVMEAQLGPVLASTIKVVATAQSSGCIFYFRNKRLGSEPGAVPKSFRIRFLRRVTVEV